MTTYKPKGSTRNPQKLAELLDKAEAVVAAEGYREADFDYDDEAGAFQHDSDRCPTCRLANLAAAYCGALRAAQEAATNRLWRCKLAPHEAKAAEATYRKAHALACTEVQFINDIGLGRRYRIEAEVAAVVADERADIMAARFPTLRREIAVGLKQRAADKRDGIIRHSSNPTIRRLPYE